ncbi:MAG: hypothetical protein AVO35_01100 [Candidatus Aegiribacteria sp. MLS_C]|nr:MAG: hypothetical protein AVO35_01100 [Candidatus Aegiribacteria sp. MLS_C]
MLSDILAKVAEGGTILLEEEDYLLARVEIEGRTMLAEVSSGDRGGIPPSEWPMVSGILHPDSGMSPSAESDAEVLLFSIPQGSELYLERIIRDGPLSETRATEVGRKVLVILRRLHDAGLRAGYLGPENVLVTPSGDHYILGGARGIPDTPFSPPEAVGARAQDPRSDVYAIGLLMFRLIAGSDNRDVQVDSWNRLSDGMTRLLERMVTPRTDDRFANLMVLSRKMASMVPGRTASNVNRPSVKRPGSAGRRVPGRVWAVVLAAAAAVALLVAVAPWKTDGDRNEAVGVPDTAARIDTAVNEVTPLDTVLPVVTGDLVQWEPVIWISNGTGQPGLASDFRQGPAAGYTDVYACTGSTRGNSMLLARRSDPSVPLEGHAELHATSIELASADSSMTIVPVDMTLLLGSDLNDDTVAPDILTASSAPAGTLFIDIANHGVTGSFGGTGAATWVRSVLNGRSLLLNGEEWVLRVVDFRDGDMLNEELGIPVLLQGSAFLYHSGIPVLQEAEEQIRRALLGESSPGIPTDLPSPPDIWILLGR